MSNCSTYYVVCRCYLPSFPRLLHVFFFFLFLETFYLYSVRDNEGWKWVWVETATAVKQCKRRQWIYSVCSLCLKYRYDGRASFRGGGGGGICPPLETLCPPPPWEV